ncbi:MAG: DUF4241 domain-containing protein [Lachnospiraceae bacterium]|nr:DUF4241 domain-containing protein [Lachnospiraceae bacterium]
MLDMERLLADAEQGVLPALKFLGDIYLNGYEENDIRPDLSKAVECYEKAAQGGMEDALLDLGFLYCSGKYMEPDYKKGIEYYRQAADMGNTTALGNLGMSYIKGCGVEKDEKKGFKYFMKAAEGGHPMAMHQVADMYRAGIGVAPDEEKYQYWEERAKEQEERDKAQENAEKSPMQTAFEKNLKFISKDTLDVELVQYVFGDTKDLRQYTMGVCSFPSGRILTADPLCYLQSPKDVLIKAKRIAPGAYPVQLAIMDCDMAGIRIVGARLKISDKEAVSYELANCEKEDHKTTFAGFPVECGMACFCDEQAARSYWRFLDGWYREHQGGNIYDDYFAALFAQSYQENPEVQREGGDLLMWSNPLDGSVIPMFASGMGDGYYTDYWGVDAAGALCELVIIFMNPRLFQDS